MNKTWIQDLLVMKLDMKTHTPPVCQQLKDLWAKGSLRCMKSGRWPSTVSPDLSLTPGRGTIRPQAGLDSDPLDGATRGVNCVLRALHCSLLLCRLKQNIMNIFTAIVPVGTNTILKCISTATDEYTSKMSITKVFTYTIPFLNFFHHNSNLIFYKMTRLNQSLKPNRLSIIQT